MSLPPTVQIEKEFLIEVVNSRDYNITFMLGKYNCSESFKRLVCNTKSDILTTLRRTYLDIFNSLIGVLTQIDDGVVYICSNSYENYCYLASRVDVFDFEDDIIFCPAIDLSSNNFILEHEYVYNIINCIVNKRYIIVDISRSCYSSLRPKDEEYISRCFYYKLIHCFWYAKLRSRNIFENHIFLDSKIYNPTNLLAKVYLEDYYEIRTDVKTHFRYYFEVLWQDCSWQMKLCFSRFIDEKQRREEVDKLFDKLITSNLKVFSNFRI